MNLTLVNNGQHCLKQLFEKQKDDFFSICERARLYLAQRPNIDYTLDQFFGTVHGVVKREM